MRPVGGARKSGWITNLVLFVLTLGSVFLAGAEGDASGGGLTWRALLSGWRFAVPLLSILLAHEFGHYIAARIHRVPASLPYFIPLPFLSPIGTMGAVIAMRDRIASRRALLDIGAAGPIAGMVVALPVLVWGLLHSEVRAFGGENVLMEGQSLLYLFLKRITVGPIPEGSDVFLHPAAFAGWVGLLITMINLLPVAQLDGGHIAYALFGPVQNRIAKYVHWGLLPVFVIIFGANFASLLGDKAIGAAVGVALHRSMFWLFWFGLLFVLKRVGGRDHPPTEPGTLDPLRTAIAIGTLVLLVLLFMPTPLSTY